MKSLTAALVLFSAGAAHAASGLGYARATSQAKHDTRPTLYQPLNLFDGREISVWCEGAEGEGVGEGMQVGFKDVPEIDEIRISTGDGKEDTSFKTHNRVKKLVVRTEDSKHTFTLVDERGPQTFKIDPPIIADRMKLEIEEVSRGTGDDNLTCLSDVIFVSHGKPLNGAFLTEHLKYDKGRSDLMNTWYSGPPGAPEKFLDFYFDGTFQFIYRPFDPDEKGVTIVGEYTYVKGKLMLKLPEKGWVDAKLVMQPSTVDGVAQTVLELTGEALKGSPMSAHFADKR